MQLSKTDRSFFNAAKAVSKLSDHRCKIGCIVVDKHRIISSGNNSDSKCHPVQASIDTKYFGCFCSGKLHAETSALIPLMKNGSDLSRAVIYTYREYGDGSIAMSRPCNRCLQLIHKLGITKIKYTTNNGYAMEILEE